jgi:hypothetical protein
MLGPPTLVPLRPHIEQGDITGATLESAVTGAGELVVCIHSAFISGAYQPLLTERSLAGHHRLITYHRHGYGNSGAEAGTRSGRGAMSVGWRSPTRR